MCVWVWVLTLPCHSPLGSVVCAFGVGFFLHPYNAGRGVWLSVIVFRQYPFIPGPGLGCVCLGTGFGFALPIVAEVCGVCVLV